MLKTVSITVSGKVQGVFYRQSTKEIAAVLNIKGEVRNMPDGTVSIIAAGSTDKIEQLIQWCKQGPPEANVINVATEELPFKTFDKFSIVR